MKRIFLTVVVTLCGAFLSASSANAAAWLHYESRDLAGRSEYYEWDKDSLAVQATTPQTVSVTWRRFATTKLYPTPDTLEISTSRVFCNDFGLSTSHQERVLSLKDGLPGMGSGPAGDAPLAEAPVTWATWGSPEGKLIRSVCQAAFPGWVPDFLAAQAKECAGKNSGICSGPGRDFFSAIRLLEYREKQALAVCSAETGPYDEEGARVLSDTAITDVLLEAQRCQDADCKLKAVSSMAYQLSTDLGKAARGQKCEAVTQRIAQIEQGKKASKATAVMQKYLACAANQAHALDDGLSVADSVAAAMHSACSGIFNSAALLLAQNASDQQLLVEQFRPQLVEIVLQRRATPRGTNKPVVRSDASRRLPF